MGATIPYGRDFKEQNRVVNGYRFTELVAINGGFLAPSYGTFEEVQVHCEKLGIDRALWPEFYDYDDMNIPLGEVRQKNRRLKDALAKLSESEINGVRLLPELWDLMSRGLIFYVTT